MSDSPRTDAMQTAAAILPITKGFWVTSDFARTLERELGEQHSISRGLTEVVRKLDDRAEATERALKNAIGCINGLYPYINTDDLPLNLIADCQAAIRGHMGGQSNG